MDLSNVPWMGAGYKDRMEMMDDRPDKTEKFINL